MLKASARSQAADVFQSALMMMPVLMLRCTWDSLPHILGKENVPRNVKSQKTVNKENQVTNAMTYFFL